MILNIIKSLPWYAVGAAIFGVPSILFILFLFPGPNTANYFSPDFIINTFMDIDGILAQGQDVAEAAEDFFKMFGWLNLNLLIATVIFSLSWSIGSHFLNIDGPGKAKFYGITWFVVTGACIATLILTNLYILVWSTIFRASQDLSGPNVFQMIVLTTVYYGLMYYLATILGTARQARSAVLFANKLPARNFL